MFIGKLHQKSKVEEGALGGVCREGETNKRWSNFRRSLSSLHGLLPLAALVYCHTHTLEILRTDLKAVATCRPK